MRYVCICLAALVLLMCFASCSENPSKNDDVTLPALVVTIPAETTNETTEETTEETTPQETTTEQTTPAVTEPDFENNPDPDGTKRY